MPVPPGELRIQVIDDELIVSLPQSSYAVTYYKPANSPQLLARRIPMEDDPRVPMTSLEEDPRGTLVATITLSHEGLCPVPAALLLVMSLALAVVSIMSRLLRAPPPVTKPLK